MPQSLMLSDTDLALAARACRALADIERRDAERQTNPTVVAQFREQEQRCLELADRLERMRRK